MPEYSQTTQSYAGIHSRVPEYAVVRRNISRAPEYTFVCRIQRVARRNTQSRSGICSRARVLEQTAALRNTLSYARIRGRTPAVCAVVCWNTHSCAGNNRMLEHTVARSCAGIAVACPEYEIVCRNSRVPECTVVRRNTQACAGIHTCAPEYALVCLNKQTCSGIHGPVPEYAIARRIIAFLRRSARSCAAIHCRVPEYTVARRSTQSCAGARCRVPECTLACRNTQSCVGIHSRTQSCAPELQSPTAKIKINIDKSFQETFFALTNMSTVASFHLSSNSTPLEILPLFL